MSVHMVKRHLARIDDSFRMCIDGRISPFILGVNLRSNGEAIGVAVPAAREALEGLAAEVDAEAAKPGDPTSAIRGMHDRFTAWRKHVEETVRDLKPAVAPVRTQADPELLAAAAAATPSAEPETKPEPEAAVAKEPLEDDVEEMSMEEIQRILDDTKRSL